MGDAFDHHKKLAPSDTISTLCLIKSEAMVATYPFFAQLHLRENGSDTTVTGISVYYEWLTLQGVCEDGSRSQPFLQPKKSPFTIFRPQKSSFLFCEDVEGAC